MAGGVALNVVANRKILEEGPFDEVFVCPAAGDAGGAIGAALWATHVVGGIPRKAAMGSAFLGEQYDQDSVQTFLKDCRVKHRSFENNKDLANTVARNLAQGAVGGWFKGRFEWGPRALGARSILADPRRANMKQRVNAKIKFREGFRPFAPAVLEEDMPQWFEFPKDKVQHLTPFMCCVAPATDEAQREIPAVVHVDGTARVQSVQQQHNPDFHELLESFKAETGVGVLLNTSMNLKDEPICASPAEAYATFMRSGLDFLVIENCLIEKGAQ